MSPSLKLLACALLLSTPCAAVSVSQTASFPQIAGFGTFSEQTISPSGWGGSGFPFTDASQIQLVRLSFSTTDDDFNIGPGPTGGDPVVEFGIRLSDSGTGRQGLVSVVPGNQDVVFDSYADPQHRFDTLVAEILDGELTLSLGAYESFPSFSRPFVLDEPSALTVTVTGTVVPEPATAALVGLALLVLLVRMGRCTTPVCSP